MTERVPRRRVLRGLAASSLLGLVGAPAGGARAAGGGPGLVRWRAVDGAFADWTLAGTRLDEQGRLLLDAATARPGRDPYPPGGYHGGSYYTGGAFLLGEATGPVVATAPFREAIVSWEADTPPGTWLEVWSRARVGERWTAFAPLGIWADDGATIARHSVTPHADADIRVAVDTLVLQAAAPPAEAVQVHLRLFALDAAASPSVRGATVATATPGGPPPPSSGDPRLWRGALAVPACSQMVYPDGGRVWCSPTSTAMVLGYWAGASGPCEDRVRAVVAGVHDWRYRGHGNWPFNTAHAAARGFEAYVARYPDLAAVEPWLAAGVPLVLSLAWGAGELAGAPLASVNGHLVVLVGFDAAGEPIVHDPAAPDDASVPRVYRRAEFERLWQVHSGGTAYVIHPPGWADPPATAASGAAAPRPE